MMPQKHEIRHPSWFGLALCGLWLCALPSGAADPGKKADYDFLSELRFTLRTGVRQEDKNALAACCALILSEDTTLMECARKAISAEVSPKSSRIWRRVLGYCLPRSLKDGRKHSKATKARWGVLLGLVMVLYDGHAYMQLHVPYLDSANEDMRGLALFNLMEAYAYLKTDFALSPGFPGEPAMRPSDAKYCKRIKAEWDKWYSGVPPAKLNQALKPMFDKMPWNRGKPRRDI